MPESDHPNPSNNDDTRTGAPINHSGPRPRMPWRYWWPLVLAPRVVSPLIVASLCWTTHEQLVWIREGDKLWLNVPTFIIGVLAIATSLRLIVQSWDKWTWRGDITERYFQRLINKR